MILFYLFATFNVLHVAFDTTITKAIGITATMFVLMLLSIGLIALVNYQMSKNMKSLAKQEATYWKRRKSENSQKNSSN